MFARRHPFLFSILVLFSVFMGSIVILSVLGLLVAGSGGASAFGEKVGVVELTGAITDSRFVVESLASFRKNPSVKAVVLRVDSPGGELGPSQEIYREVKKTVAVKKVVVSMGSVAASGGYYVSSCASGIMANPGTITGSIGVILAYTNFKSLMDKVGISPVVIKSGKFKDVGSPFRDMTAEERAYLSDTIMAMYGQFLADVSAGRKIPVEKLREFADGRVFTGIKAKELGLVDRLGNYEDAIAWAAELGGISGEPTVVYARKHRFGAIEEMLDSASQLMMNSGINLPRFAYLWLPSM